MLRNVVIQTIRQHNLLAHGQRILVGVSGGADSVALLAVLRDLSVAWKLGLTVAHLDHGIRGPAAVADAAFVAGLAKKWKLKFISGRVNVPVQARRRSISLEMAGRLARYNFFAKAARAYHCDSVATAHTADDQAETILLNLVRGAGAAGLAGIPYVGRHGALKVVRPLRDVNRKSIEQFLEKRHIVWCHDATNADPAFLRNRVRHEVLPLIADRLNPGIRPALLRVSDILASEHEWLNALAADIFEQCRTSVAGRALVAARLSGYPVAARRRVLRHWLTMGGLEPETLNFDAIERLDNLVTDWRGGRAVTLSGGWLVSRARGLLSLSKPENQSLRAFSVSLIVPGQTRLPEPGCWIRVFIEPGIVKEYPETIGALPARASLSLRAWRERRLLARSWKPGDRMRPLGMQGTKKLQDIFSDGKVSPALRHKLPVIECQGEIVWLPGFRIAQGWEVCPDEHQALQVVVES